MPSKEMACEEPTFALIRTKFDRFNIWLPNWLYITKFILQSLQRFDPELSRDLAKEILEHRDRREFF